MPSISAHPTVLKGSFTVLLSKGSGPARGMRREFMFNPNAITDSKEIKWAAVEVAGASHPVYQFASGGERLITFEVYLDGDRGGVAMGRNSLSIKDDIEFFRSLRLPSQYDNAGVTQVAPPLVLFSFGPLWDNVQVIVKKADPKVTFFTRLLEPVRATVSIALAEVVPKSVTGSFT